MELYVGVAMSRDSSQKESDRIIIGNIIKTRSEAVV